MLTEQDLRSPVMEALRSHKAAGVLAVSKGRDASTAPGEDAETGKRRKLSSTAWLAALRQALH
jgi:hypothetical protein